MGNILACIGIWLLLFVANVSIRDAADGEVYVGDFNGRR